MRLDRQPIAYNAASASTIAPPRQLTSGRIDATMLRTFAIAAVGGALEFYDFIIFVFLTLPIGQVFFPPETPSWLKQTGVFGLFAAGYLARPLGGLLMGHVGDTAGRKRMFMLGIMLMSLPTFLIGLLPTYAQIGYAAPLLLLACRILQGAAVGGEIPGSWVYVAEHAPRDRTGLACGLLTTGLTSGILLGSLVNIALHSAKSPAEITAYAWRLPFLLGGIIGLLGTLLRRKLTETPIFEAMRRTAQLAKSVPLKHVLLEQKASVLLSMAATWFLTAEIIVMILMAPVLLQSSGSLDGSQMALAGVAAAACLALGCTLSGVLIDRFGLVRFAMVAAVLVVAAAYLLFGGVMAWPHFFVPIFMIVGLVAGSVSVVPVVMVRAFPAATAFTGISLAYNVAYAIAGGFTPPLVSALSTVSRLAPAHYVALVGAFSLLLILANAVLGSRQAKRDQAHPVVQTGL